MSAPTATPFALDSLLACAERAEARLLAWFDKTPEPAIGEINSASQALWRLTAVRKTLVFLSTTDFNPAKTEEEERLKSVANDKFELMAPSKSYGAYKDIYPEDFKNIYPELYEDDENTPDLPPPPPPPKQNPSPPPPPPPPPPPFPLFRIPHSAFRVSPSASRDMPSLLPNPAIHRGGTGPKARLRNRFNGFPESSKCPRGSLPLFRIPHSAFRGSPSASRHMPSLLPNPAIHRGGTGPKERLRNRFNGFPRSSKCPRGSLPLFRIPHSALHISPNSLSLFRIPRSALRVSRRHPRLPPDPPPLFSKHSIHPEQNHKSLLPTQNHGS